MENADPNRGLTDELIVIQCQLGERAGFDALIVRWHEPVWKYVRRLVGDDARAPDVAQDVWVRVIRGIGRVREPRKFSAAFSVASALVAILVPAVTAWWAVAFGGVMCLVAWGVLQRARATVDRLRARRHEIELALQAPSGSRG